MARKNSKQTRYDGMTQRQQRRADRNYTKQNDSISWTDKLFEKLKESDPDENSLPVRDSI